MGLTISYQLKFETDSEQLAREKITALHQIALDMPFARVSELVELKGKEQCRFNLGDFDDPDRFLKLEAARGVHRGNTTYHVDAEHLISFLVWPGEGCESARFGLAVFPKTIKIPRMSDKEREEKSFLTLHELLEHKKKMKKPSDREENYEVLPTDLPSWSWSGFCKTQYASNPKYGGIEHFLKCHGLIIKLLDHAQELGMLEEVIDDAEYWEHRDLQKLAHSVGHFNTLVAGILGGLDRMLTNAGVEITNHESPISEYPNYEYLEAQGEAELSSKNKDEESS